MAITSSGLFRPSAVYGAHWSGHIALLAPGAIPTVDYYLTPRLENLPVEAVLRFDSRRLNRPVVLPRGTFVVVVRHANRAWLHAINEQRQRLSGVAFLMDDDIPAAWRCDDVPLDYGLWTTGRYLGVRGWLSRVCDRLWVSTPALQRRYPGSHVVPPLPFKSACEPAPAGTRRWGYHGTRIHARELRWLVPVVSRVQSSISDAVFEVFGGKGVAKLFEGIPRVEVLPALTWPDYVTHCEASNLAVGLAPLLPGMFNAVRSHTKVFDITRCGAVGIFSAREPYATLLSGAGASLLPDDQKAWARETIRLLQDDALRLDRYRQVAAWMGCFGGNIVELIAGENSAGGNSK